MNEFEPPSRPRLELLPTDKMTWEQLENLLRKIAHEVEGLRDVRIYGTRGQSQYGIDVVGVATDGSRHAFQSKKYEEFTKNDLTKAVKKFINERGKIPFPIARFTVVAGCLADRTEITDELYRLQEENPEANITLWHQRDISDKLRNRQDIVTEFFSEAIAQSFCLSSQHHVVPDSPLDRVALADALAQGPSRVTGADVHLAAADQVGITDPATAANELERAGQLLEAGGFTAHASVILERRATLLAQNGEYDRASKLLSTSFWQALEMYPNEASGIAHQLNDVAKTDKSQALNNICKTALRVVQHPLGEPPSFSINNFRTDTTVIEFTQLLILMSENCAINPNSTWRQDNLESLISQADLVLGNGPKGDELAHRLRIEIADTTGDWADLLLSARRNRIPRMKSIPIFARHALYHAEHGEPETADLSWEDAIQHACLEMQNDAAAEYVFSRKILLERYQGPRPSDHHQLVRSLLAKGNYGRSTAERLEDKAANSLLSEKYSIAIPLLRAFYRAAYRSGSWGQVTRARELLADTYSKTDEPHIAAHLYALSGKAKKSDKLTKDNPNQYLDVRNRLSDPTYWSAGTAYRITASQSDLVPDEQIHEISSLALETLDQARAGTLRDGRLVFDNSVERNSVRALASLAGRLSLEHAQRLLDYLLPCVSREPNTHHYTDDDHVSACANIARETRDVQLRTDSFDQLMGLLSANDSAVSKRVERSIGDLVEAYPELIRERLVTMAAQNNQYACRLLQLITEEPSTDQIAEATSAAVRLRTPPNSTSNSFSLGTGAPNQALLASVLPPTERRDLAKEQLIRARWPHEPGENRAEYYDAARILAHDLEDVDDLFEEAFTLASDRSPSFSDIIGRSSSYPLDSFRSFGAVIDTRPPALFLAAALARSSEQKTSVRDLALMLISSNDYTNNYVTHTLRHLDIDIHRDIPFLATQSDWGLRSLAAVAWVRSKKASPLIGIMLATDDNPSVRRSLARALYSTPSNSKDAEVKEQLSKDPCHSVRKLVLTSGPGGEIDHV